VVASYYVVVYIATALPAVGVGALTVAAGPSIAIQAFAYAVIAICLLGLTGLLIELRARAHSEWFSEPLNPTGTSHTPVSQTDRTTPDQAGNR
jgi:hypothetical protein